MVKTKDTPHLGSVAKSVEVCYCSVKYDLQHFLAKKRVSSFKQEKKKDA
jgi:hypothetical protein